MLTDRLRGGKNAASQKTTTPAGPIVLIVLGLALMVSAGIVQALAPRTPVSEEEYKMAKAAKEQLSAINHAELAADNIDVKPEDLERTRAAMQADLQAQIDRYQRQIKWGYSFGRIWRQRLMTLGGLCLIAGLAWLRGSRRTD